jgi:IPT/TIG domain
MIKKLFALFLTLASIAAAQNCTTSSATVWISSTLPAQVGNFTTTPFTVTPTTAATNGGPVVGLSQSAINSATYQYGQNATLIRQSDNGYWELFNGATGAYAHDIAVKWVIGTPATFVWTVAVPSQTATLQITQAGSACATSCTLASTYKFRAAATSIGFWNLDSTSTPLIVCNLGIATPVPQISSITPSAGSIGTSVVISGMNFGGSQGNSQVSFGGVNATTVSAWGNTSITATVPNQATTGNVIVTTGNQVSNGFPFVVAVGPNPPPPVIVSVQSNVTLSLACGPTQPPPTQHSVQLAWTASNSTTVTSYNVYRSVVSGSGYIKIGSTNGTLSYNDVAVSSGATYYYVVTAVSSGLESIWSNQVAASIP